MGQRLLSEVPQLLEVARAMTPQMALRRDRRGEAHSRPAPAPAGRAPAAPCCRATPALVPDTPTYPCREWSEFSDFVAGVVAAVDEGRLDEVEAQKQLAPAVIYQVSMWG